MHTHAHTHTLHQHTCKHSISLPISLKLKTDTHTLSLKLKSDQSTDHRLSLNRDYDWTMKDNHRNEKAEYTATALISAPHSLMPVTLQLMMQSVLTTLSCFLPLPVLFPPHMTVPLATCPADTNPIPSEVGLQQTMVIKAGWILCKSDRKNSQLKTAFCQNCQNGLYGREVWTNIRPQCVYQIQTPLFLLYDWMMTKTKSLDTLVSSFSSNSNPTLHASVVSDNYDSYCFSRVSELLSMQVPFTCTTLYGTEAWFMLTGHFWYLTS